MCAHLCVSVHVSLLESSVSEGSCWLHPLPVFACVHSSLNRKWQEANQKVQELQASQEVRADQEQRIKDLEQKLSLQEQDAAIVKNMR
ncbi:hypothetical protein K5549_016389, partial [Capra hircus]